MGREKRSKHKFKRKAGEHDYHHLKPKKRGGQSIDSNLLRTDLYKHDAIHLLFGDKTLDEIIAFLQRVSQAKQSKKNWVKLIILNS